MQTWTWISSSPIKWFFSATETWFFTTETIETHVIVIGVCSRKEVIWLVNDKWTFSGTSYVNRNRIITTVCCLEYVVLACLTFWSQRQMLPTYFAKRIFLFVGWFLWNHMKFHSYVAFESDEKYKSIKCLKMTCDVIEYCQNQNRGMQQKGSLYSE